VVGSNKISDACGACLELDDEMRDSKFPIMDGIRSALLDECCLDVWKNYMALLVFWTVSIFLCSVN
jgi:hypothetical protein